MVRHQAVRPKAPPVATKRSVLQREEEIPVVIVVDRWIGGGCLETSRDRCRRRVGGAVVEAPDATRTSHRLSRAELGALHVAKLVQSRDMSGAWHWTWWCWACPSRFSTESLHSGAGRWAFWGTSMASAAATWPWTWAPRTRSSTCVGAASSSPSRRSSRSTSARAKSTPSASRRSACSAGRPARSPRSARSRTASSPTSTSRSRCSATSSRRSTSTASPTRESSSASRRASPASRSAPSKKQRSRPAPEKPT